MLMFIEIYTNDRLKLYSTTMHKNYETKLITRKDCSGCSATENNIEIVVDGSMYSFTKYFQEAVSEKSEYILCMIVASIFCALFNNSNIVDNSVVEGFIDSK